MGKPIAIAVDSMPGPIRAGRPGHAPTIMFQNDGNTDLLTPMKVRELVVEYLSRPQERKVSIIMPVYNRAATVATAIRSIAAQSYTNWELLIVDDGSVDETGRIVESFLPDVRVIYTLICHEGVSGARNTGLAMASGDLIAYLDSDNEWHPDYLLFSVNWMADHGSRCGYTAQVDYNLDKRSGRIRLIRFDRELLFTDNYIDINVFMHEKSLLTQSGMFDPSLMRWVDWDLIFRITRLHEPSVLPVILCYYYRKKSLKSITITRSKIYKNRVMDKHCQEWRRLLDGSKKPLGARWWARINRTVRYHKREIEHRLLQLISLVSGNRP